MWVSLSLSSSVPLPSFPLCLRSCLPPAASCSNSPLRPTYPSTACNTVDEIFAELYYSRGSLSLSLLSLLVLFPGTVRVPPYVLTPVLVFRSVRKCVRPSVRLIITLSFHLSPICPPILLSVLLPSVLQPVRRLSFCPSARLSVCPFFCPSVLPATRHSACPSARLSICPARPLFCTSVLLPVRPSAGPSLWPSVLLLVRPSARSSFCPSVCPSGRAIVYLST